MRKQSSLVGLVDLNQGVLLNPEFGFRHMLK